MPIYSHLQVLILPAHHNLNFERRSICYGTTACSTLVTYPWGVNRKTVGVWVKKGFLTKFIVKGRSNYLLNPHERKKEG